MTVNIKGLRAFSRILARGTLRAAAEEMHISESALSRQLSLLEEELDLLLFHREKGRLIPTSEARAFVREAERLLDSLDQLPEVVNGLKRGLHKSIRIIAIPRLVDKILVPAVSTFLSEQPRVEITIEAQPSSYVERWVAGQQYDFGLSSLPLRHKAVEAQAICRLPAVVVLRSDNPLASKQFLTARDLKNERLVAMPSRTQLGNKALRMLEDSGVSLESSIQTSLTQLCCRFVSEGQGITFADPLVFTDYKKSLVMVPLKPKIMIDFGLIYPRGQTPGAEARRLSEMISSHAEDFENSLNFGVSEG